MLVSKWIIGLAAAGLVLGGCANSPWAAKRPTAASSPASEAATTASPATTAGKSDAAAQPDPRAMQDIMAELQQLGAIDPGAQERLMADLRQSDPSLWPLVMQQFRATLAYRRRAQEREVAAAAGRTAPDQPSDGLTGPLAARPLPAGVVNPLRPQANGAPATKPDQTPASNSVMPHPVDPPPYPQTGSAPGDPPTAKRVPEGQQPNAPAAANQPPDGPGRAVKVSYETPVVEQWRASLGAAIRDLESQSKGESKAEADLTRQAQLRMLYLLAGRRDDALRPILAASPGLQDFWAKQLYGLDKWLDAQRTPDALQRAAEAKQVLAEAVGRLGESAPLSIRNVSFCTEVQSYGCLKPFARREFLPDQEVLLYAEVDNFSSEPTAKGFFTALRSSYQIFDSRGQRVADHEFTTTEEYCQNPRRDFFIVYHLRLPKRIYPGKYTLQLTIEDLKSKKVGQSSVELTMKDDGK